MYYTPCPHRFFPAKKKISQNFWTSHIETENFHHSRLHLLFQILFASPIVCTTVFYYSTEPNKKLLRITVTLKNPVQIQYTHCWSSVS